jgi:hypothetical protein
MSFRSLAPMEYSDDEKWDRMSGPDVSPPDYPPGLQFSICQDDLTEAGAEDGEPGDTMRFAAMGEVTSIFKGREDCRIEIQIGEFAGDDGKFFDLSEPCYISLCSAELDKMGLDADCERGDMIHLIGEARLENMSSSSYGGERCMLQVTHLTFEDESEENRED